MARPISTSYSESQKKQIVTIVCEKLSNSDITLAAICELGKGQLPHPSTIREWCRDSAELAAVYSRAMTARADYFVEQMLEIADTEADSHKARNRIQARQWVAGKLNPAKYSDKLNLDVSGSITVQDDPASLKSALAIYHILQSLQSKAASAGEVIELPKIEHVDNSK